MAVIGELADVARVQPPVGVDRLGGRLRLAPVAEEHRVGADEDLAVVGDRHLDPGHRSADGAELQIGRVVEGDRPCGLGHAEGLDHRHTEGVEEPQHLGRHRRTAGDRYPDPRHPRVLAQGAGHQHPQQRPHEALVPPVAGGTSREASIDQATTDTASDVVGRPLEGCGLRDPVLDAGEQLLVDPWHGEQQRRTDGPQVRLDRVDRLREVDLGPAPERRVQAHHLLGDVAQGQVRQHLVGGRDPQLRRLQPDRPHDVAPGEHGALRLAGGARRVDQDREVVGFGRGRRIPPLRVVGEDLVPEGEQVVEVEDALIGGGRRLRPASLQHDHRDEGLASIDDLERLVELLLVLGDEHRRGGVVQLVGELRRRVRRVDPEGHRAEALGAEAGVQPLRPVLRLDRDAITTLHTERGEASTEPAGGPRPLRVGDLLPASAPLGPQRHPGGCDLLPPQQQLGQRGHAGLDAAAAPGAHVARRRLGGPRRRRYLELSHTSTPDDDAGVLAQPRRGRSRSCSARLRSGEW